MLLLYWYALLYWYDINTSLLILRLKYYLEQQNKNSARLQAHYVELEKVDCWGNRESLLWANSRERNRTFVVGMAPSSTALHASATKIATSGTKLCWLLKKGGRRESTVLQVALIKLSPMISRLPCCRNCAKFELRDHSSSFRLFLLFACLSRLCGHF